MSGSGTQVSSEFQHANPVAAVDDKEKTYPFCLRLTKSERAYLEQKAGNRPLGRYIREQLLGDMQRKRRVLRKPKVDDQKLALLLAEIGQSRLSSNLNQLAKSANMGTIDVSDDVEAQLADACAAVMIMRDTLMMALGLKTGGAS